MVKYLKKTAAAVAALAMAVSMTACGSSDVETTDTIADTASTTAVVEEKSDWDELDQTAIAAAMGMGWNLGNQLEANSNGVPSETAWGNPVIKEELFKAVKDAGFSTVRIPVSYLSMIGEGPDYKIDEAWLNRVQEVVDYAINNELYVVMNIHGDGYYSVNGGWLLCVDENQDEIKAKFKAVWTQIADRFKDYDEHLIFESMNEVFDGTYGNPNPTGYENINAYNQIFVDAVRDTGSNNTKRWLLVPGWNTNIQHTTSESFVIPQDTKCESDSNRIMISVHYYDPYNFTLDENMSTATTQWGQYAIENFDNWGQQDYVDSQMKLLNDKFTSQGYPVIIGEMGVQNKSHVYDKHNEFRRYWNEYVVKAAKANGCIPVYWDNGWNGDKGFGLFNRLNYEVTQPEIIEGIMRAITSEEDYEIPAPVV